MIQNFLSTARCSNETTALRNDQVSEKLMTLRVDRAKLMLANETGFERVKRMYSLNEYGMFSPELEYIISNCSRMAFLAGITGAAVYMKRARDDYFRKNVASTFESQHLARRGLQDSMTLSGFRGAITCMIKYGGFSSLYLLSTMTAANYHNKVMVWEHAATGAVLGSLVRLRFGLKGMAAAGAAGGFLGVVAGSLIVLTMRMTGTTIEDMRMWQHEEYYLHQLKKAKDA